MVKRVKPGTVILHSKVDGVIRFAESRELLIAGLMPELALMAVGRHHRLADLEPVGAMLETCQKNWLRSQAMNYDHHDKAGNRGDVVKHVALVAALDSVMDSIPDPKFRYADTFAGYANNPLTQENKLADGWGIGIGSLIARRARFPENPHVEWWAKRYLISDNLEGIEYPGSSRVAKDVCEARDKSFHAALWDTSPAVIADLKEFFDPKLHQIVDLPARPDEELVKACHFLFIDPPGLKSDAHPEYPPWETLRQFIETVSRYPATSDLAAHQGGHSHEGCWEG